MVIEVRIVSIGSVFEEIPVWPAVEQKRICWNTENVLHIDLGDYCTHFTYTYFNVMELILMYFIVSYYLIKQFLKIIETK